MRKIAFAFVLLLTLSLALPGLAAKPAVPEATWADLRAQLDKGATTVMILNSMTVPEGETLECDGTLTIEGGGNTLTGGLIVVRGTVVFKDTILCGANGVEASDGGAALTLKDARVRRLRADPARAGVRQRRRGARARRLRRARGRLRRERAFDGQRVPHRRNGHERGRQRPVRARLREGIRLRHGAAGGRRRIV